MAPGLNKKRKAAPSGAAHSSAKKSKKSAPSVKPKAPTASEKAASSPIVDEPTRSRPTRKTAADYYSDGDESEDDGWAALQGKAAAKDKKQSTADKKKKESAAAKKAKKSAPVPEPESQPEDDDAGADKENDGANSSDEEEADDQTIALLRGFDSSDDEGEVGPDVDGKAIVKSGLPDAENVTKKLKTIAPNAKSTPGIIYLGRIPHGFYENEMRSYFSQFGDVTRLRLSRNKKTGASKHYAFIEFADEDVAKIACETMNNYLLFQHILKARMVPRDNLEYIEKLFKGANRRFKKIPVAKIERAKHDQKKSEEHWNKKLDKENKKRKSISERLKAKGIDYEFEAPVAKKAKTSEATKTAEPMKEIGDGNSKPAEAEADTDSDDQDKDAIQVVIDKKPTKNGTTPRKKSTRAAKSNKAAPPAKADKEKLKAAQREKPKPAQKEKPKPAEPRGKKAPAAKAKVTRSKSRK